MQRYQYLTSADVVCFLFRFGEWSWFFEKDITSLNECNVTVSRCSAFWGEDADVTWWKEILAVSKCMWSSKYRSKIL